MQQARSRGRAQGSDQAEPRPDARRPARLRPLWTLREHCPRQQLARRRPGRPQALGACSTSLGSPRTWGWRSSSTSPAASATCDPTRSFSWRPCGPSSHHAGNPDGGTDAIEVAPRTSPATSGSSTGSAAGGGRREPLPDRHRRRARGRPEARARPRSLCRRGERGVRAWARGATALAEAAIDAAEQPSKFEFAYPIDAPIEEKIRPDRDAGLRSGRRRAATRGEAEGGGVRAERSRRAADRHGEDAPFSHDPALRKRAYRLHGAGSRSSGRIQARDGWSPSAAT